jgi:hypothetical protein
LHQVFETLGNRAFTAAHRSQQIENLFALLQALGRMAKEAHHLLDGIFHAVELREGGIAADDLVGKQRDSTGSLRVSTISGSPMTDSMRCEAPA